MENRRISCDKIKRVDNWHEIDGKQFRHFPFKRKLKIKDDFSLFRLHHWTLTTRHCLNSGEHRHFQINEQWAMSACDVYGSPSIRRRAFPIDAPCTLISAHVARTLTPSAVTFLLSIDSYLKANIFTCACLPMDMDEWCARLQSIRKFVSRSFAWSCNVCVFVFVLDRAMNKRHRWCIATALFPSAM